MLTLSVPAVHSQDVTRRQGIENEQKEITITVYESSIEIKNAEKKLVEIYNLAGVRVASYRIDSSDKTFDLSHLSRGCYIVKVENVARKIYLK